MRQLNGLYTGTIRTKGISKLASFTGQIQAILVDKDNYLLTYNLMSEGSIMRENRLFFILVLIFLIFISAVSCGKKEVNGGNSPSTSGLKEFSLEKYGFALKYDKLILNDKIDGDQFVELKHLSGDTATVTIKKPDPLVGDKPEEWLKNSFKTSDYKIYQRKEMKLGKYPGLLVEYAWKVMGKPIRTIDLTAYKDGYFYSLIVIMREENVEDVRKEFDKVVKSFNLFDSKVDLDTL
jgi:hypothetical protein